MKNNKFIYLLILIVLSVVCLCSCEQSQTADPNTPTPDLPTEPDKNEKYTVAFFNGDTLIYTVDAKPGEYVNIPNKSLLFADPRFSNPDYEFIGWEGIDEFDMAAGKVEVFYQDAFYHAVWKQRFGTSNKFSVTELPSSTSIVTDGVLDDVYLTAEAVTISTVTAGETDTTATMYFMFDDNFFYIFADVKDSNVFTRDYSYSGEQWTEHNDAIEFWIDLLHNDSLASPNWSGGWGGEYRGEPGPMCEAHFKMNAGYNPDEHGRFGAGSEAIWDGWWSNQCNDDGISYGVSKITATGYTVEYRINLANNNIPSNLKMLDGQEIGIGIKIYDKQVAGGSKNVPAPNVITLESINHVMNGPRKLSTFIVNRNED